jgi:hypothetical protein
MGVAAGWRAAEVNAVTYSVGDAVTARPVQSFSMTILVALVMNTVLVAAFGTLTAGNLVYMLPLAVFALLGTRVTRS